MTTPIYTLREGQAKQWTTFDIDTGAKSFNISPGEKKVFMNEKGCGVISRLWLTFPGWFWQHWNESACLTRICI